MSTMRMIPASATCRIYVSPASRHDPECQIRLTIDIDGRDRMVTTTYLSCESARELARALVMAADDCLDAAP